MDQLRMSHRCRGLMPAEQTIDSLKPLQMYGDFSTYGKKRVFFLLYRSEIRAAMQEI